MELFSKKRLVIMVVVHVLLGSWCITTDTKLGYFLGGANISMIAMWYLLYSVTRYVKSLEEHYFRRSHGGD